MRLPSGVAQAGSRLPLPQALGSSLIACSFFRIAPELTQIETLPRIWAQLPHVNTKYMRECLFLLLASKEEILQENWWECCASKHTQLSCYHRFLHKRFVWMSTRLFTMLWRLATLIWAVWKFRRMQCLGQNAVSSCNTKNRSAQRPDSTPCCDWGDWGTNNIPSCWGRANDICPLHNPCFIWEKLLQLRRKIEPTYFLHRSPFWWIEMVSVKNGNFPLLWRPHDNLTSFAIQILGIPPKKDQTFF